MSAKSALDSSGMSGSKRQLENRMTRPPKVREAVSMLKDRFAAQRDVGMREKWQVLQKLQQRELQSPALGEE